MSAPGTCAETSLAIMIGPAANANAKTSPALVAARFSGPDSLISCVVGGGSSGVVGGNETVWAARGTSGTMGSGSSIWAGRSGRGMVGGERVGGGPANSLSPH